MSVVSVFSAFIVFTTCESINCHFFQIDVNIVYSSILHSKTDNDLEKLLLLIKINTVVILRYVS